MSFLIDNIYTKVKTLINTEVRGNVSPSEFNLLLHNAIQSRNEEYVFDINRAVNRENRGLGTHFLANIPDRIQEKVNHYIITDSLPIDTASSRNIPDDCKYIDEIEMASGETFEFCKNKKEFNIIKPAATEQYPIYRMAGDTVWLYPEYSGLMQITYWRKVKFPKWTFQLNGNTELFNPSAPDFEDADIHPSEENEMVRRVLLAFGINLKESDIIQMSMNEDQVDFNQSNTN